MAARGRGQERSMLTGTLRRIDRRVRLNGALDHLSIAVCVVLGLLLLFQVGKMLLPVVPPPGPWVVGASAQRMAAAEGECRRHSSRMHG